MSLAVKRLIDMVVSTIALLLLAAPMSAIVILIWRSMGLPVLFKQRRAGREGRAFTLIKFRTMDDRRDGQVQLLPDADRLTKVGVVLRRFSLDELPQFWNVLIGDMSLVGPRPLLLDYLERYSSEQARRHEVRPGITGWAQINGRNALDWPERFRLDIWYVNHRSLVLDARIICKTVRLLFGPEQISRRGHATMTEFTGNP